VPQQPDATILVVDQSVLASEGVHLDQYFGLWAVEETRFLQMCQRVGSIDLRAHVAAHAGDASISAAKVSQEGGDAGQAIAVIEIEGTLTKRGSSLSAAGSLVRLRQAVRAAVRDPDVGGILLRIDSPGGTVAGTADMAREVAAAAKKKPVYAFAEDLTASAAYWIASQAEKVFANDPTAMVGSIGTFVGLYDYSGYAAKEGIRAVVIKAGKYKGAGFAGTEITEEQRGHWQQIVDETQAEFSAGVAAGRRLPAAQVDELADGRVHTAAKAQSLGLIDGIQSFDQTLAELASRVRGDSSNPKPRKQTMSETTTQTAASPALPQPASYNDLKAALPGADADFICSQLGQQATVAQAQTAWMTEQNRRIESARASEKQAVETAANAGKKTGVQPLGPGATREAAGDAIATFESAVSAKIAGGKPRAKAVSDVIAENPQLHEEYLAAYRAAHPTT
jgi:signal peptide peptidase SppA